MITRLYTQLKYSFEVVD